MTELTLALPSEAVEELVARVAQLVLEQLRSEHGERTSPYASVREAADHLRAKPQRVYDLISARTLPVQKDGGRTLIPWASLEAHLAGKDPVAAAQTAGVAAELLPPRSERRSGRAV